MNGKLKHVFAFAGISIVFIISITYFLSAATLMANCALSVWQLPVAALCGLGLSVFFFRKYIPASGAGLLLVGGAVYLSYLIAYNTTDISWDGMWYHQTAVIAIVEEGVNLYHNEFLSDPQAGLFINHYSACAWVTEAAIFKYAGNVEVAKMITPLWGFAVLFLAVYLLRYMMKIPVVIAAIASVLIALNPVVLNQYNTFYIDGQIASQLTCLLLLSAIYMYRPSACFMTGVGFVVILLVNMKFTTVIYACMFIAVFMAVLFGAGKTNQLVKYMLACSLALALGFFVFGAQPYARNLKDGGHVFYPLMGENKVDIMNQPDYPQYMTGKNNIKKFALSLASFTVPTTNRDYSAKGPFVYQEREYEATSGVNWIIGGMGPFFSGILLLSILLLVQAWAKPGGKRLAYACLFVACGVLASVIINPENWSARYVPQLWLVPFVLAVPAFRNPNTFLCRLLIAGMLVYAAINCHIFIKSSIEINQQGHAAYALNTVRETNKKYSKVVAHTGHFDRSFKQWLKREHISNWQIDTTISPEPCAGYIPVMNTIRLCPE